MIFPTLLALALFGNSEAADCMSNMNKRCMMKSEVGDFASFMIGGDPCFLYNNNRVGRNFIIQLLLEAKHRIFILGITNLNSRLVNCDRRIVYKIGHRSVVRYGGLEIKMYQIKIVFNFAGLTFNRTKS